MTDTTTPPAPQQRDTLPLTNPTLPGWAPILAVVVAWGLAAVLGLVLGWPIAGIAVLGWVLMVIGFPIWASAVEGTRKGVDRLAGVLVWTTFGVALLPLGAVIFAVLDRGIPALSADFFLNSQANPLEPGQGIYHAIIGTLIVTAFATVISVPVGVMAAIYLVEYGKGNRLARTLTFLVDVMTGIPSIVAGLFALALFKIILGEELPRLAFGGSVALSVLMIPIVVRATEEMLKLVSDELREASYALGVPKWRTIVRVVLPTSLGGILTGVTLAIARITGETAPLLLIAGTVYFTNFNPFDGAMQTLPVFIFSSVTRGGPEEVVAMNNELAWGAALVLIAIVMLLNLIARFLGSLFAPKTGR